MNIRVHIVSGPQSKGQSLQSLIGDQSSLWRCDSGTTAAEQIVEFAGRICYGSFPAKKAGRSTRNYILKLIRMGHESVLEHANWTMLVTGVSRSCTHQLVRHRVGFTFSQLSQQYHIETATRFVCPAAIKVSPVASKAWRDSVNQAQKAYDCILDALTHSIGHHSSGLDEAEIKRTVRSAARSVLPNATETMILLTANARALRHFLRVRGGIPGDEEMRKVAVAMLRRLRPEAPSLFADFHISTLPDGSPIVSFENSTKQHDAHKA